MHLFCFFAMYFTATKRVFLFIEIEIHHCITEKKHLRKTILLYIIVTNNRRTYLGIAQSMKRKFVRSAANT